MEQETSRLAAVLQSARDAAALQREQQLVIASKPQPCGAECGWHQVRLHHPAWSALTPLCVRFYTTSAALRAKSGFFTALLDGVGCAELDSEKCVFIDRSPVAFRFVLKHLRGEPLDMGMEHLSWAVFLLKVGTAGTLSALEKEILQCDADFYELDEL